MSRNEQAIVTALCMVYDDNKLLLQNRVKEDWRGITFPGGHIEKEESFVQGIKREILEETGLTIHNPQICGIKQFQTENDERYIVLLFKTNQFDGRLVSSEEGEMFWIERELLQTYPIVDDFMELLKVFDSEDINEMMYERQNGENDWVMNSHSPNNFIFLILIIIYQKSFYCRNSVPDLRFFYVNNYTGIQRN